MTILIRLYPRDWRDRYEREFLDVLESRPPSRGDRLDIVRGAIDARLNPAVPGAPFREPIAMRPARIAGVSAFVGGIAYLAWTGLILLEFRGWNQAAPEHATLGIALAGVSALALAAAHAALALAGTGTIRRFGPVAASVAAVCFAVAAFVGGALVPYAFVASIILAAAVAGRSIPTGLAVLWVATTLLAMTAMLGFGAGGGEDLSLMLALPPLGVAWVLIGAFLTVRGVPSGSAEAATTAPA
jgi:hypothetical protein